MTTQAAELIATLGIISLIALPALALLAFIERPRYRVRKGRRVSFKK